MMIIFISISIVGFLKAKLAFATEKFEEVIPACTEELNLSESESDYTVEALSLRASFYFLYGQFNEALEDLTTIIETKEADNLIKVNSYITRASIYMQTDKMEYCLDDYDKAAELGPDVSGIEKIYIYIKIYTEFSICYFTRFKFKLQIVQKFKIEINLL